MTDRLDLTNAVVAAGGAQLAPIAAALDVEKYMNEYGAVDTEKVQELVDALLPKKKLRSRGSEAGLAAARERWPAAPGTTTEVDSTVKTSKAREAGLAEARRRFGNPS